MPSTKTTTNEKPNDGSCAACNKEGAVFQCAPCRDAGVDVFFCNRECQVRQWKTHKVVCKKTSDDNLEKKKSSTSKEDKAEGKRLRLRLCENCMKKEDDVGSNLSVCSKCKKSYYCSRECQVAHWPKHKSYCKYNHETSKNIERSFDSREKDICNLVEKWVTKSKKKPISAAVYFALKKRGIEQQPPVKVVLVEIEFDYNAQTFVVAEVPRAMAIADLSQDSKEMITRYQENKKEKRVEGIEQVYNHFVILSTKELGERYKAYLPMGISKSQLDHMNAADIDMDTICFECAQVPLKSDLFREWESIRINNLQRQMEQMKLGHSYTVFVQNALQFFCKKSLQNTHRISVLMKMGQDIGQISKFLEYKVMTIAEFKEFKEDVGNFVTRVEDIIEPQQLTFTDIATKILFVDADACFAFEHTVFCGVNDMKNKTAKQCKKAAEKHFRKLQLEVKKMPADLLEKMSL
ncbi:hypothetical protein CTEN210_17775 [Chaetoceros tenuissimus]|uniref:MYND-type domain-containing protein n=1 Tax=Chaetoceros tenuissimus TaxID=426638 RepID=A0AAD3DBA9_9STRA|nr:hypothetical protein CTEN210_17775 [Chaetoceros tenuissimus]